MFHAGLKSLRLYRRMCRLMPYLLRIHEMYSQQSRRNCKVTPIQAKIRAGDFFRANSMPISASAADKLVQEGYELLLEFEWHYSSQSYLYKYIAPTNTHRDQGRNNI